MMCAKEFQGKNYYWKIEIDWNHLLWFEKKTENFWRIFGCDLSVESELWNSGFPYNSSYVWQNHIFSFKSKHVNRELHIKFGYFKVIAIDQKTLYKNDVVNILTISVNIFGRHKLHKLFTFLFVIKWNILRSWNEMRFTWPRMVTIVMCSRSLIYLKF